MDNYKIKVKDEAESKEAQELFVQLGFEKTGFSCDEFPCYLATWEGGFSDYVLDSLNISRERKELTLPQLLDLVVLKRNDVKDANHTYIGGGMAYKTCEDICYLWSRTGWEYKGIAHNLVPIQKHLESATGRFDENGEHHLTFSKGAEEKDPALISGAEALRALADGKGVEYSHEEEPYGRWTTISNFEEYSLDYFLAKNTKFKFRIKPQTIKLELELPKPFEPKVGDTFYYLNDGEECGYVKCEHDWAFDPNELNFGAYRTEDDVKKAVEQLRKIRGAS